MTELEPFFETTCVSSTPQKMCGFRRKGFCNEPAISLRESQKIPQHNAQFLVLVSTTVTKVHTVSDVRARYHKTGARIVNLKKKDRSIQWVGVNFQNKSVDRLLDTKETLNI
jgi:hypothetical protein